MKNYVENYINCDRKVPKVTIAIPESSDKISQVSANAKSSDPPKVVIPKVISLFARKNDNDSYKIYQTNTEIYFPAVMMIFDIPLCNSKGALPLYYFFKNRLSFVCTHTLTILLITYLKINNMKQLSPNRKCGCFQNCRDISIIT